MSTESQKENDISTGEEQPKPEEQADEQAAEGGAESAEQTGEGKRDEADQLQADLDRMKEELLRAHADMQNLRRRAERDVENAHKFALDRFVGDLLPVVDNLERALKAIDREDESMQAVTEGIELTLKSFVDVLRSHNVEQVAPEGEPFDPERHQAMSMVPDPDRPPNTVIEVFQKGYLLNGRLVRPAMVVVSKPG